MVSAGGKATAMAGSISRMGNTGKFDSECPFVVEKEGSFYLFGNQICGENNLSTQYGSSDPLSFGVDDDRYRLGTLNVAAVEIIDREGQDYNATLLPSLDGIRIAKLTWTPGKGIKK